MTVADPGGRSQALPHVLLFVRCAPCGTIPMSYIPQVEDAIWLNFLGLCFREERLYWDPEQCEQLTLQVGELRLEHLDGASVLD
jgi:hypothetical protein